MAVLDRGDVRRTVDKIRRVVEGLDRLDDQELRRLHSRNCEYVASVNEELEACETLIDRHDESAAVQRAERSNVLELIATLSFADRVAWEDYVLERGFTLPDALRVNAAKRISKCYGPARQREPLLREQRWHALARSPLRVRLEVMRRIHRLDATPEAWEEDIRQFEQARLEQIETELQKADADSDLRRLDILTRELKAKDWLLKPDKNLVNGAQQCHMRQRAREARRQIPGLLEKIRNAESAGLDQIGEGRKLKTQLLALLDQAALPEPSETRQQVQEAILWVNNFEAEEQQQADYRRLLAELEQALDVSRPQRDRLQSLEFQLRRFDEGIPALLDSRLKGIYDDLDRSTHRGHMRNILAIVSAVAAAAVLMFVALRYRADQTQLAEHEARLRLLIERKDFVATTTYIEKLEQQFPKLLDYAPIAALVTQFDADRTAEQVRQDKLKSGLEQTRESLSSSTTLSDVAALSKRLTELNVLCRGENEQSAFDAVQRKLEETQSALQTHIDEQFSADLEKLSDQYAKLEVTDTDALAAIRTKFQTLLKRPEVSDTLRVPLQALVNRSSTQIIAENSEREQRRLLDAITQAVGTRPKFQALLDDFGQRFPQSPRGLMFQRILKDEPELWNLVEEHNQFAEKWSKTDFTRQTPAQAAELAQQGREFLTKNPLFSKREVTQQVIDYLTPVAARLTDTGTRIDEPLFDVLRDPTITGLFLVLTKEGKRYYSDEEPKSLGGGQWQIRCFRDASLAAKVTKAFPSTGLNLVQAGDGMDWVAPQTAFAKETITRLTRMTDDTWEESLLAILDRLHDDSRMDPILRFQLLDTIVPVALKGSLPLQKAFGPIGQQMRLLRVGGNLNLFDPEDIDTNKARLQAVDFLKTMPDPSALQAEVLKSRERLNQPDLGGTWRWVGWLMKDRNEWRCAAPLPPATTLNGDLFVVTKPEIGFDLFRVGSITDGKYQITVAATSVFVEGRPVYLSVPRMPATK